MKIKVILIAIFMLITSSAIGHEVGDIYLVKHPIDQDAGQPREVKVIGIVNAKGINYVKIERCYGGNNEKCFDEWIKEKVFDADILVKLPNK